ncbi:hypothetical protein [Deinococcus sp.]|uniref:prealbumin-like fold domain-containing protein n=1 Tax=Deinococcus sp. TaxID=47478 RepID=UPI0025BA99E1|nr:hypothetical protein [Deinococcus sp.]
MRKKILMVALALALAGGAGAQTTCTAPITPTVPPFNTSGWTLAATLNGAPTSVPLAIAVGFDSFNDAVTGTTVSSLRYDANQYEGAKVVTATSNSAISLGNVRYLNLALAWSNYGIGDGFAVPMSFQFGPASAPVTYLTLTTPAQGAAVTETVDIFPANGAKLYNDQGQEVASLPVPSKGINTAIVGLQKSYDDDRVARKDFFIKLPDNAPSSGVFRIVFGPQVNTDIFSYGDDFRIWMPGAVPTTLCVRKELDTGAPATFDFTATGLTTPTNFSIAVPTSNTPYASGVTPYTVDNPAEVIITETTPGYVLRKAECTKPLLPQGKSPQTTVTARVDNSISIKAFSFGGMTVCTLYNTPKTNLPKFTVAKTFAGFLNPNDSAAITVAEAGGPSASTTVSNISGNRTGQTSLTGTLYSYTTTNTAPLTTATGRPASVTMSESLTSANPANYTSKYACTNAAATSATTLPANGTGKSVTIGSPNFGDDITCRFTNDLTVAPPTTTVNATKSGLQVVTAGTAVAYSITASNTTATAVDVDLTDQLSPVLPAAQVTSISNSGTYNATSGLVTWPRFNLPANGSVTRTLTVDLPDPVRDSTNGDSYSGPNQVSDTASLKAYTVGTNTLLANNGTPSASLTTNHIFAKLTKTVRNVTTNSAAGTSVPAKPGDILEYCLNYTNQSAIALNTLTLRDTLVAGQTLQTAVLSLTRGSGAAQPTTNSGTATVISTTLTNVAAGETGSLCFQTKVNN